MSISPSPRWPRPGELVLGKYDLTAAIGGGSQEIVYEARERRTQRLVALRWSLSSTDSELYGARGDGPIPAVSQFRHSSVFETLEVVRERGALCTVLDWRPGESLEARVGRLGPLPMEQIARLLAPCIRGVMAAHVAGIVQHLIKPTTVYLCAPGPGQPEQAKLLPFELDRRRGQQLLAAGGQGGEVPAHRLPESRAALLADPRADVRSFGAMVQRALSGKRQASPGEGPGSEEPLQPIVRWFLERSLSEHCDRPFQTLAELVIALENISSTMPRASVDRQASAPPAKAPEARADAGLKPPSPRPAQPLPRTPTLRGRDDTPPRRHRGPITARQRRVPKQAQGTTAAAGPPPPQRDAVATPEPSPPANQALSVREASDSANGVDRSPPPREPVSAPPAAESGAPLAVSSPAPANLRQSSEHPLVWVPTRQLGRGPGAQLATRHGLSQLPTQPLPQFRKRPELDRTLELSPAVPTLTSISRAAHGVATHLFDTRLLGLLAAGLVIVAFILTLLPERRRASIAEEPPVDRREPLRAAVTVAEQLVVPPAALVHSAVPFTPPPAAVRAAQPAKAEASPAVASRRANRTRDAKAPAPRNAAPAGARSRRSAPRDHALSPLEFPPPTPVRDPSKPAIKRVSSDQALDQMGLL